MNREYYPNCASKLQKFLIKKNLKCDSYKKQGNFIIELDESCLIEGIDKETLIKEVTKQSKRGVLRVHTVCWFNLLLCEHFFMLFLS